MKDIRFGPSPRHEHKEMPLNGNNKTAKRRWLLALALLAVFAIGLVSFIFWPSVSSVFSSDDSSAYNALFLTNGQVYFGKILKQNKEQVVLEDVFYLQAQKTGAENGIGDGGRQAATSSPEGKMTLVKQGGELHGPTDQLFINKSQLLFYEELRSDSKVLEAIKNYKNQ